jgi:hypothetical protein
MTENLKKLSQLGHHCSPGETYAYAHIYHFFEPKLAEGLKPTIISHEKLFCQAVNYSKGDSKWGALKWIWKRRSGLL